FPADIVNTMPPWKSVAVSRGRGHHAELGDLVTMMYPWRVFAAAAVRHFALPLWNHHILLGTPFLANGVSAVFYPVNYLYYILPIPAAWGLRFVVNTLIVGTSMALFVRAIGGSIFGAIGAAVIFACCGYITAWQGWPHVDTAIWLPLMLFSVHRLFRNPSWRSSLLVSAAFAMPVFGGHPEIAVYVILAGTGFALARLLQAGLANLKDARRCLLFFAAGGILAIGLASAQWIPTVTWIGDIWLGTFSLGADTPPDHQGAEALAAVVARGFQLCGAGGPGNLGASARNEQAGLGSSSSFVPESRSCRRHRRRGAGALAPSGPLARAPGNFRIPAVRRSPADCGAGARERRAQAAIFRNDDCIVRGSHNVLPRIHTLRPAPRHLSAGATLR